MQSNRQIKWPLAKSTPLNWFHVLAFFCAVCCLFIKQFKIIWIMGQMLMVLQHQFMAFFVEVTYFWITKPAVLFILWKLILRWCMLLFYLALASVIRWRKNSLYFMIKVNKNCIKHTQKNWNIRKRCWKKKSEKNYRILSSLVRMIPIFFKEPKFLWPVKKTFETKMQIHWSRISFL